MNYAVKYALIGVGVVAVIGVVAYVASKPSQSDTPQFADPVGGGHTPPVSDPATELVRGGFGLANVLADRIADQVGRDRDIAARERRDASAREDREFQDLVDAKFA